MATAASAGRGLRALMRAAARGASTAGASTARSVAGRLLRGAESSSSLRARATPATTRAGPASGAMRGFACGSAASLTRRSESARAEDGAATSAGPGAASEGDGATSPGASDAVAAPSPLRRAPAPRSAMRSRLKDGLRDSTRERVRAIQKQEKGSPKKFNDVCRLIRGLTVADAIHQCALSPKRYAKVVMKVVASAAANAENNHDLDKDKLVIVQAFVGKGTYIKRSLPHGRGRSGVMTRPRTHIRIEVEEREPEEAPGGAFAAKGERRKMQVRDAEAPWKRHRRRALEKYRIAQEAGLV